ncbi:sulfurtransferase TusA family protein [Cyanobium sp. CH-040]|uniref:sulfurtransferase TusA family protein n=1 Tax=Cyanobium sp. CH-040 TaxID=2823708 RepID=UPI0020CEE4E1|nr:sulfurtransferase TusA family protein [Cyanobium sp. CH-040]MCP9927120.1 sulfurtransferase TusA family protein [Cyanobium sp. CH-040]
MASTPPTPATCLDLRGTPCPLNFIRSRLALEALGPGEWLQLDLDAGEPEQTVSEGLRQAGHRVQRMPDPPAREGADPAGVRLLVRRHDG